MINQQIPFIEDVQIQVELKFNTKVLQNDVASEQRIIQWNHPLRTFNLSKKIVRVDEIDDLKSFHALAKGSYETFLYQDKSDYQATTEQGYLYPIPSSNLQFQLCKKYLCGDSIYYRPITHLVASSIKIYSGTTLVTNWTLGNGGLITLASAMSNLTVEFEFDVPVRFESDNFDRVVIAKLQKNTNRVIYEIPRLILKEVKVKPYRYPVSIFNSDLNHDFELDLYRDAQVSTIFSTELIEQSSGFEKREDRQQVPVTLINLQGKNVARQSDIDYLLGLFLNAKAQGCFFDFTEEDTGLTYQARFNSESLVYTLQSNNRVYSIASLQIRLFKEGVIVDNGHSGLTGSVLTLAQVCQLELDNLASTKLGFSTFDETLIIDGVTYDPLTAIDPSASERKVDLSPDNQRLKSILYTQLEREDIYDPSFEDAVITSAVINWRNLPSNLLVLDEELVQIGIVGEVNLSNSDYEVENISKATSLLNQESSIKTSPMCRYQFGDDRCKKDLSGLTYNETVTALDSGHKFRITGNHDNLGRGTITFTSGNNEELSYPIYISHSDGRVELLLPTHRSVAIGDTCTVVEGCDHTETGCKGHSNFINFGGEPSGGRFMRGNKFYIRNPTQSS